MKVSYSLYRIFIFWISVAVVMLLLEDIVDLFKHNTLSGERRVRGGLIWKVFENVYIRAQGAVVSIMNKKFS